MGKQPMGKVPVKTAPPTFHRYEPFESYENQNVKNLVEQIEILKEMIKIAEDELNKIRNNCHHYYQFSSSGMYEDNYVCKHCGQEDER